MLFFYSVLNKLVSAMQDEPKGLLNLLVLEIEKKIQPKTLIIRTFYFVAVLSVVISREHFIPPLPVTFVASTAFHYNIG